MLDQQLQLFPQQTNIDWQAIATATAADSRFYADLRRTRHWQDDHRDQTAGAAGGAEEQLLLIRLAAPTSKAAARLTRKSISGAKQS